MKILQLNTTTLHLAAPHHYQHNCNLAGGVFLSAPHRGWNLALRPSESSFEFEDNTTTMSKWTKVAGCTKCLGAKDVGHIGGKPCEELTMNVGSGVEYGCSDKDP